MNSKKKKLPHRCNKCDILLTNENWPPYLQKIPSYRCRTCNNHEVNKYKIRIPKPPSPKINYRLLALKHYSDETMKCKCCGESIERFLTIDHINNDGREHRKTNNEARKNLYKWLIKNNYPDGFQVLCYNCNCGKALNNGVCPHKILI